MKSVVDMLHRLQWLTVSAPGTGKTEAICDLAKVMGARVMVHHVSEALRVAQQYGVKAITIDSDMRGMNCPVLVDTHAVSVIAARCRQYIEHLEQRIKTDAVTIRKLTEQRDQLIGFETDEKRRNRIIQSLQYELLVHVATEGGTNVPTERR